MRPMTPEDLGDPRLYEDEAIREQAARLQIHMSNLIKRLDAGPPISLATTIRIHTLTNLATMADDLALNLYGQEPNGSET